MTNEKKPLKNAEVGITVPDGERWIAKKNGSFEKEKAGWEWHYLMKGDQVLLSGQHLS